MKEQQKIEELKKAMQIEQEANFPNGDLWNNLSDELDELQRVPTVFEMVSTILNSEKQY